MGFIIRKHPLQVQRQQRRPNNLFFQPANSLGGLRAIRINRVSNKYASAKQTENCRNRFSHLTHP
jgi:hypothetical protein